MRTLIILIACIFFPDSINSEEYKGSLILPDAFKQYAVDGILSWLFFADSYSSDGEMKFTHNFKIYFGIIFTSGNDWLQLYKLRQIQ